MPTIQPFPFGAFVVAATFVGGKALFALGDGTYDGKVDFSDLVLLAQKYGSVASLSAMVAAFAPAPVAPPAKTGRDKIASTGRAADVVTTPVVKTTALGTKKVIR